MEKLTRAADLEMYILFFAQLVLIACILIFVFSWKTRKIPTRKEQTKMLEEFTYDHNRN